VVIPFLDGFSIAAEDGEAQLHDEVSEHLSESAV
jgi:hypothetical protein